MSSRGSARAEHWIERRCGILGIAFVGLASFLVPHWIVSGFMARSGTPELTLLPVARAASRAQAPFHATSADPILARNPFDSTGAVADEARAAQAEEGPPLEREGGLPACPGVRVSAIAFSADVDWSVAVIVADDGSTKTSLLRRRGGKVGDRLVDHVGVDRVRLRKDADVCEAGFFAPPPTAKPVRVAAIAATPTVRDPRTAGISRTGPNELEVDRSVIERVRQDPSQLMAFGQLVPERDASGTTLGVRLGTLKPGTLPAALALESGDRLDAINGYHVANLEELLSVYARLSSADTVSLDIVRQGRPQTIHYTIR